MVCEHAYNICVDYHTFTHRDMGIGEACSEVDDIHCSSSCGVNFKIRELAVDLNSLLRSNICCMIS